MIIQKALTVFAIIFLAACSSFSLGNNGQAGITGSQLPPPQVALQTFTPTSTALYTPSPVLTPTPSDPMFPYTIQGLRIHDYKSGKIHIIQALVQNDQYTTYYIDYPSDGLRITGILQIPVGGGPFPVIVMNHGFFTRETYFSGDGTDRAAEFLVKRGFITVSSDYRSWGDSDIGNSFFYSGLAIDVINLIRALPSVPQADINRIGIWGHSMGGGATMKVLAILGTRLTMQAMPQIRAAVLYSTVSADQQDVIDRWGPGCLGDIATGEKEFGCNSSDIIPDSLAPLIQNSYREASSDPDVMKKVSPYYFLKDIAIPIQIHYGAKDGILFSGTPPAWSKKLYQGFVDSGNTNVKLFGYDGETHSFKSDEWFAFMERTSQFFEKYVANAH